VDRPDKIRAFLPEAEDLVTEGLIILDEVEVVHHVGRGTRDGTDKGQDDDAAHGADTPRRERG
jgi:hypothetical protein